MSGVQVTLGSIRLNQPDERQRPFWSGTLTGLGGAGVSVTSEPRVQADGQWSTVAFRQALALGLQGLCKLGSVDEVPAAIGELERAVALSPVPLTVHWPSGDATILVRRDGAVVFEPITDVLARWSCTVVADDPVWFAGDGSGSGDWSQDTGLPANAGGITWPVTWPATWEGEASSGDLSITTVSGGAWWWRIQGPVENPRVIVTLPDGRVRTVAWTLTLAASEWLEVDPQAQRSMLQGQASRPPTLRQWPALQAGTTTVQFRASTFTEAAQLSVRVRPAI